VIALLRMRLVGFVRTGRALPPLLAGLVVLGVLYGGGQARAGEAYGVSAVVLFPVLAWQAKLLLDGEPDVQRRLALVAVGDRLREVAAGLLAAASTGLVMVLLALVLPWLLGGVRAARPGEPALAEGIALGLWAHLLVLPAAVALGALASRAATGSALYGIAVLAVGVVGAIVLGLKGSVAPWLAPPMMAIARATTAGSGVTTVTSLTGWALGWSAVVLAGYGWLRRRRA
jgi:hypothetical protein